MIKISVYNCCYLRVLSIGQNNKTVFETDTLILEIFFNSLLFLKKVELSSIGEIIFIKVLK